MTTIQRKERDFQYVVKVVNSCKTRPQTYNAVVWAMKVLSSKAERRFISNLINPETYNVLGMQEIVFSEVSP